MSHDNIFVKPAFFFLGGHHGNGMLRPVHARSDDFGHPGIGFDKFVPVISGIYHIYRRCHNSAGVCDEICAGFHFQTQRASGLFRGHFKGFDHMLPDHLQIRRYLARQASDFVSTPQTQCGRVFKSNANFQ